MGEDPCGGGPGDCGDMDDKGPIATPDMPAGWLILQSFTTFHNVSSFSRSVLVILIPCQPTVLGKFHNIRCRIAWPLISRSSNPISTQLLAALRLSL